MSWDIIDPKEDTLKVLCSYLLEVCQERGVLYQGTWRTLRVPDFRLGGQAHL